MNSEKHKQLIQKMKYNAFTNPHDDPNKIYKIVPDIASGIVYPNEFVSVSLTYEKTEDYDCLHFSTALYNIKKSKLFKQNPLVPDDELSEWAKLIFGDAGENALDLLYELKPVLANSNVRHLELCLSKTTGKPIDSPDKEDIKSKFTVI